jgi:hypothetical protein
MVKNRGGKREGAGRHPVYSEGRMVSITISIPKSLCNKINQNRSEYVRRLIEKDKGEEE